MCQAAIITFHDVYNFGASLQAYALARFLNETGHNARIIDYKPDYITRSLGPMAVSRRWDRPVMRQLYSLAKLPSRLLFNSHRRLSDQFTRQYLPLTPHTYRSLDELRMADIQADLLIAGSGQIWNPRQRPGQDPAFFLRFGPKAARRVSYAPSFTSAILPQGTEEKLAKMLDEFDSISVREASGVQNLERMGLSGTHVCDPVFLLSQQAWSELASKAQLPAWVPEKYVLLYDVEGSPLLESRAHDAAEEMHRPVIKISGCTMRCGWRMAPCGPLEFLALIFGTREVWSNSYHALAFSKLLGHSMNLVMRADISNMRLLDLCNLKSPRLQEHIDESANYLLSQIAHVMKDVS